MPNLLTHLTIGDKNTTINSVHYIVGTGSTAGTWLGTDASIKEYYELHSADRFDKLNEMDKFLDRSVTKTDIRRKRKSNNI